MALHFDITADNSNFLRKIEETKRGISDTTKQIESDGLSIEDVFKKAATAAAAVGAGFTAKELISNVVKVRGEFQQLEVAFKTMLGSEEQASKLMSELVDTAAKTPFDLQGVANGAKQLLAYGVSADDVNGTLVRLGDIAAGLSMPLNDLVYLYGTTMVQGRLFTQDLRQFQGRGIPLADELAKKLKIAKEEVGDFVTAGKVGFDDVKEALESMTNKGGKFGGLMAEQSKTITGQISNIEDDITSMFNSIGTSSEGVINSSLSLVSGLVANWETVAKTIGVVATAYGTYKAALLIVNIQQKIHNTLLTEAILQQKLAAMSGIALSEAESLAAAKTVLLSNAFKGLKVAIMSNPIGLTAGILAGIASAFILFNDEISDSEKKQNKISEATKSLNSEISKETILAKDLFDKLKNAKKGTDDYRLAKEAVINKYGSYISNMNIELSTLKQQKDAYDEVTKAVKKSVSAKLKSQYIESGVGNSTTNQAEALKKIKEGIDRKYSSFGDAISGNYSSTKESQLAYEKLKKQLLDGNFKDIYNKNDINFASETGKAIAEYIKSAKEINDVFKEADDIFAVKDDKTSEIERTKNKSYWEDKKKTAQGEYDALTEIELNSKKGLALKKKIKEYEKEIEKYSITKTDKEYEKEKKNSSKSNQLTKDLELENQKNSIAILEESREKKLKQIDLDYEAQKNEIIKKSKELSDTNKEAGLKGLNSNGLTKSQQAKINEANKINEDTRLKSQQDLNKLEIESMQEYLKQYGTYQQQKLAIAEEYAEKIKNAQTEGERLSLMKQKESATQQVEVNAIKQSIDWGSVFGEFGALFKDQLQPTIDKLKTISQSDDFKKSSLQDQQTLYSLIEKLQQSNTVFDSDMFNKVSDDLISYQDAMRGYISAQEKEKQATLDLADAKKNLKYAENSGDDVAITKAHNAVNVAQSAFNDASKDVVNFGNQVQSTTSNLQTSSANIVNSLHTLSTSISNIKSGSLKGVGDGFMDLDKLLNGGKLTADFGNTLMNGIQSLLGKDSKASKSISEALGGTGMAGEIISGVLGILDLLKDGVSGIITSLQDTIFGAIEGILDDLFSGDILVKPLTNAFSHIGNILNTVTFGGLNSWLGIGGNSKETAETIAKLTSSNEALKTSIDSLKDEIKGSNGSKSIDAYNESVEAQKRYEENLRQILDANMNYHSAHHSNASYWDLNDSSMSQINSLLGTSLNNSWSDFSKLTADQMDEIRKHLPDVWSEMIDEGKYGERFKDDWNNYADQAGKVVELTQDLQESLTQISFDSLRDSFVDKLMDMNSDAEDFGNDINKTLTKALLNFSVGDKLDAKMKDWYASWANAMNEQNGELSEKQISDFQKEWDDMVKSGIEERDKIAQLTGYDKSPSYSQEATSKSYETISQDTGKALEGRATAMQISSEKTNETATAILACISQYIDISTTRNEMLDEIKNIIIQSNGHLENIAKYTKCLTGFNAKLDNIINELKGN